MQRDAITMQVLIEDRARHDPKPIGALVWDDPLQDGEASALCDNITKTAISPEPSSIRATASGEFVKNDMSGMEVTFGSHLEPSSIRATVSGVKYDIKAMISSDEVGQDNISKDMEEEEICDELKEEEDDEGDVNTQACILC